MVNVLLIQIESEQWLVYELGIMIDGLIKRCLLINLFIMDEVLNLQLIVLF